MASVPGRYNNKLHLVHNKLGGGGERDKVQRAAKRYENDVTAKIGSRLLLLLLSRRERPPPQTNRRCPMTTEKRHRAKILAVLRRVAPDGYGAPCSFQPNTRNHSKLCAGCIIGVGGAGCRVVLFFLCSI